MDAEECQSWEEELTFDGLERDFGDESDVFAFADELHLREFAGLFVRWLGRRGFWRSSSATLYPESESGNSEAPCDQHGSREVVAYADEAICVEQDVEEEALVEVLKDVTFRIVPLSRRDAREMIHDIQGFPVLAGYRGAAPADLEALHNILLTLSAFVESTPEVKEIDLNPIYAYAQGALVVDARVVLEQAPTSG